MPADCCRWPRVGASPDHRADGLGTKFAGDSESGLTPPVPLSQRRRRASSSKGPSGLHPFVAVEYGYCTGFQPSLPARYF